MKYKNVKFTASQTCEVMQTITPVNRYLPLQVLNIHAVPQNFLDHLHSSNVLFVVVKLHCDNKFMT